MRRDTSENISIRTPSAVYDVVCGSGLLADLHAQLTAFANGRRFRPFLVTSPALWELWSEKVRAGFPEAQSPVVLFLPPGEKHKRLSTVESLAGQLAEAGADRDALLIAFGGGVVGDVTGFLASIYMRGIPYVQIPTTLLAQVDSSVGGKTGVNLAAGKNLIGSFHHPLGVVADADLLTTLPPRELRAGLQESIKAAILGDPRLFRFLEANASSILAGEPESLRHVVTASVRVKAEVVALDEKEAGLRMTLNLGHTLGHAIEAATGFRRLLHGEAVAWGLIAALHLALTRNAISAEEFARIANLILAYGPLPHFKASAAELVARTATDKKQRGGKRAFVLPTGIGSTEVVYDVSDAELQAAASAMLGDMAEVQPGRRKSPTVEVAG